MGIFTLGSLTSAPAATRPDLLAPTVFAALQAAGLLDTVGVVEIDPDISDTAATQAAFGLDADTLANCVIVAGKRDGIERIAACVILASTRADVNSVVKKRLDVRKASFLGMDVAVSSTGMEYGGITPIGLPADWPVYVDTRVAASDVVIIGSGVRRSKLLVPGSVLAGMPGVEVVDDLARPVPTEV